PAAAVDVARESVTAAAAVAAQAPAIAQQPILEAASRAFLDGMHAGSWVAAGAARVGAVFAFMFLPARHVPAVDDQEAMAEAGATEAGAAEPDAGPVPDVAPEPA
ncbi:MAG TPA: hypothetical protein VF045_03695, partial [Acidimicrobiales bacterium]